jgi:hypothetical protein
VSSPGRFMQWAQNEHVSRETWLARVMLCVVNLRNHREAATQRSVGARLGVSPGAMHDVFKLLLEHCLVSWPRYSRGRRKKFLLAGVVPTVRGIEAAQRAHALAAETQHRALLGVLAGGGTYGSALELAQAAAPPGDVGERDWKMGLAS